MILFSYFLLRRQNGLEATLEEAGEEEDQPQQAPCDQPDRPETVVGQEIESRHEREKGRHEAESRVQSALAGDGQDHQEQPA